VFHYELEFIHPFHDGNGRIGRFWHTLLLSHYHEVFEYVPIESVIRDHQEEYYAALEVSDKSGDSTAFVQFSLGGVAGGFYFEFRSQVCFLCNFSVIARRLID